MPCKTFGNIPDLYPLVASSITLSSYGNKICLHTLPNILWHAESTLVEYNCEYFYLQKIKLKRVVDALFRYL